MHTQETSNPMTVSCVSVCVKKGEERRDAWREEEERRGEERRGEERRGDERRGEERRGEERRGEERRGEERRGEDQCVLVLALALDLVARDWFGPCGSLSWVLHPTACFVAVDLVCVCVCFCFLC